jgi:cAMP-dependent protein kinase regulator
MDNYERSKIADAFKDEHFKAGDVIIKEGEEGNTFYIVAEGEAQATKILVEGEQP